MTEINKDLLLSRIIHSRDLTALEKRYLEKLVAADSSNNDSNKVGYWIEHRDDTAMTLYECSCCTTWFPIMTKTCPCGARMIGGDPDVGKTNR